MQAFAITGLVRLSSVAVNGTESADSGSEAVSNVDNDSGGRVTDMAAGETT
jgi:hypothetical protein